MNDQEKQWFGALTKDRSENANVLEKDSMSGIWRSVVDKYSDQAHFIYELLQNADDAKATSVSFKLDRKGLYFIHNGSVRFSVSNPQTEGVDKTQGNLGHINAITSAAQSNKVNPEESTIGKFGVGFKAVFQYTQTPHIYDPSIRFKIQRFIVPHLLEHDLDWREEQETVFYFPFDRPEKDSGNSYKEILNKLKSLEFPTLFLSCLKLVVFEAENTIGKYTKTETQKESHNNIESQRIALTLTLNGIETQQNLLMFSEASESGHTNCIGYALNQNGGLKPINRPAFCFFPTREETNLNFIIHAPFLLTDSREGIKAGERHNQELIQQLANLAANSLLILRQKQLIHDDILDIIPYSESNWETSKLTNKISFKPFYLEIKKKFQTKSILPAIKGEYASKAHAYWGSDRHLVKLFSDNQLEQLLGIDNARWVFRTMGKKEVQQVNPALASYIDGGHAGRIEPNLVVSSLDPERLLLGEMTARFIEKQSYTWLHELYAYLRERHSYQRLLKKKPIFIDQHGNAVAAFDDNEEPILFLPDAGLEGYTTINMELLTVPETRDFIKSWGISKPSFKDEIYNKILPQYESGTPSDVASHFVKFFSYFKECKNSDVSGFIRLIKDLKFLKCKCALGTKSFEEARNCYFPDRFLKNWFETKPETKFLRLGRYRNLVGESDQEILRSFFEKLGVNRHPRIWENPVMGKSLPKQTFITRGREHAYIDRSMDGCMENLREITASRSLLLWEILINYIPFDSLSGIHTYIFHGPKHEPIISRDQKRLKTEKWLLAKNENFKSADTITIQQLSDKYDTTSTSAQKLIAALGIRDESQDVSHLSAKERNALALYNEIAELGLTPEEAIELCKRQNELNTSETSVEYFNTDDSDFTSTLIQDIDSRRPSKTSLDESTIKVALPPPESTDTIEDHDDFIPQQIDYHKKIERAKNSFAAELDRLTHEEELYNRVVRLPRYSYGWFTALLELEYMANSVKNQNNNTISISFGKVEQDLKSTRTIILKEPSRFIPQFIEEYSGVPVDLDFGQGRTARLHVESFTAREFKLFGKLESAEKLNEINLSEVLDARIEVKSPSFLLQELIDRFRELKFEETYDMKANLTPDIEFVFGPPGTGKTTHLAKNVLIPMMQDALVKRVLVLAPTNKAADVLTARIIDAMGTDTAYLNWLIRFGTSADERIEQSGVLRDRSFNLSSLQRSITVTTVARFAYDGFTSQFGTRKLHNIRWDVIVVDEASMVPLANIILPLYYKKPKQFIIAGDPFQIEPIVTADEWKEENIYTLVGLHKPGSFMNPSTQPHNYPITNLMTQYRSIPAIGDIFSRFTYSAALKHHRKPESQRALMLNNIDVGPLNLIRFPVSRYESVYRARKLDGGTSYQTYSGLFTFEFARWLSPQIVPDNDNIFKMGIIAPYRGQANMISKLVDSWDNKPDVVDIQVGTIHGFQGDECDLVIAVFNPPPTISGSSQMFLNKQNILNVAISRARDYLFILMPDDETDGFQNLEKLRKIEQLVKSNSEFAEYHSHEIEEIIWGNSSFLEENTFSTGHQTVNVYQKPERKYEVRSDSSAIDIQIHEQFPVNSHE